MFEPLGQRGVGRGLQVLLFAFALLAARPARAVPLPFGDTMEDAIAPGEVRHFEVEAGSGTVLHLRVEHRHIDFTVRVLGPDGSVLAADALLGSTAPVTLTAIAARPGPQRIEVQLRSPTARGGRFQITLAPAHPATDSDRMRVEAERLRAEAHRLADSELGANFPRALELYRQSTERWKQLGDVFEQALTLSDTANLLEDMNRLGEARADLEQALPLWRAVGDRAGESRCLDGLGQVLTEQGEPRAGLEAYTQALALLRALGPLPYAEGRIVNGMAVALQTVGDMPGAVVRYTEALQYAREDGDESAQATCLTNRANPYLDLGEYDRALDDLGQASARFRALGNSRGEGVVEFTRGLISADLQRYTDAWRSFERALPLLERAGADRIASWVLNNMGRVRLETGRYPEASALFAKALEHIEAGGDRRTAATIRLNIARVLIATGRADQARANLALTCSEFRTIGDRTLEGFCLYDLARAELALGLLDEARRHAREALERTEETREALQASSSRSAWIAKVHSKVELLASVLFALHAREPERGWDTAALEVSEMARARTLLDVLRGARVDVRAGVDPALLAEEKQLDDRGERARRTLVALLGREHRPEETDALQRELESLRGERERLEARMRASSPRYAALAPAAPLSLAEVRAKVLDDSTVLLEYLVGEEQSFVWAVSRRELRAAILPGRAKIERAVAAVYRRWSDPAAIDDGRGPAATLSRMVLGPVASALRERTVLVVADGALQQIPFAALPLPGSGEALLERHTVVNSPSASVLAALRSSGAAPRAGGPELAILADPVVQPATPAPRTEGAALSPLLRSMEDAGLRRLEPLPGSRREAVQISAHLPKDRVFIALGPDASRATAMGVQVAQARIVHFATHALLDVRRPELSGIVVSERDASGGVRNGFLTLADVSSLRLSAELVVLSACRTGLGKDVRGEGLMGLTRGFMHAGTPRVLASLWKVSDRATASLMSSFYAGLLEDGLAPAEALRAAQRSLRRERRTSAPHAWAGFVLQGDWRPLQTAQTRSPISVGGTAPRR